MFVFLNFPIGLNIFYQDSNKFKTGEEKNVSAPAMKTLGRNRQKLFIEEKTQMTTKHVK